MKNNSHQKLKSFMIAVSLFMGTSALAQHGSGTEGGGVTIQGKDRLYLLDLRDNTNCDWWDGKSFLNEFAADVNMNEVFSSIAQENLYMSLKLKREFSKMRWCLTEKLKPVNTIDEDSITQSLQKGRIQTAIRDIEQNIVYVDRALLLKMPSEDRRMLYIHEVLHSFLPLNETQRNNHLRSMVASIHHLTQNEMNSSRLDIQIKMNGFSPAFMDSERSKLFMEAVKQRKSNVALELLRTDAERLLPALQREELASFYGIFNFLGTKELDAPSLNIQYWSAGEKEHLSAYDGYMGFKALGTCSFYLSRHSEFYAHHQMSYAYHLKVTQNNKALEHSPLMNSKTIRYGYENDADTLGKFDQDAQQAVKNKMLEYSKKGVCNF